MAETSEVKAPQYLSFTISGTDYGLPILAVKEILQHEEPTAVPGVPPSIRGVIDVRGHVVPVVDLAVKFGRGCLVGSKRTCIMIVEARVAGEQLVVGVLVDAVNEVLELPENDVERTPTFGANVKVEFLTGIGKVGKRFVLLLDVDRVLSRSEAELAAEAVAAGAALGGAALGGAAPAVPKRPSSPGTSAKTHLGLRALTPPAERAPEKKPNLP